MDRSTRLAMARRHLDGRIQQFSDLKPDLTVPKHGWVRTIRQAIGMSERQLANRLKVSQPAVVHLEQSEESGSVKLASLRRAAEALDCTLVYALVPNKPLDEMVRERTLRIANQYLRSVEHTMQLEDQSVTSPDVRSRQLDELVKQVDPRTLWDES